MDERLYRDFDRLEDRHWWFEGRRRILSQIIARWRDPSPTAQVLDIGCGTGGMIPMLREFGIAEGMDGSPAAIGFARERLGPEVPLHLGRLPDGIPSGRKWDLIGAFDVLEHVEEPVGALKAIRGALSAQGTFVCTVPAFPFLWSEHDELNHHFRRYGTDLLRQQLVAAGFAVQFISYFNALLFPPIVAVRLVKRLFPSRRLRSDAAEVPALLNKVLTRLFSFERYALPRISLPLGLSLVAVGRHRADGD